MRNKKEEINKYDYDCSYLYKDRDGNLGINRMNNIVISVSEVINIPKKCTQKAK